jgi:mono/diheme cytochrome c family protein
MMRLFSVALAAVVCGLAIACAEPRATEPIARGAQVYREKNCGSCHQIGTNGGNAGPPLTHIGTVAATREPGVSAEDYLRESVLDPGAYVVPGYTDTMPRGQTRGMTQEDFDDLIRYLLTLQ